MNKREYKNILIILIPLILILFNFRVLVYNYNFYEKEFEKNNLYEFFPKERIDKEVNYLLEYIKNGKELKTDFLSQKEKLHMEDIKKIINNLTFLLYFLFVIFLIFLSVCYKEINKILISGGIITLILLISLYIINFNVLFIKFHTLFFNNDFWLLDPTQDNLIVLFPKVFFYDFFKRIIFGTFIAGLFVLGAGLLVRYKNVFKQS